MARYFQVTTAGGMSAPKLDSQGRATVQYTVKNVSARPIDGRAVLISLPVVKPPNGPVEKGWVKIDGNTDRHFVAGQEETFLVTISVPPRSDPGNYTFRLDTVWVDETDEGDAGPAVRFEVPKQERKPGGFPLWLIPVMVLVLAAVGVGVWLLFLRGVTVPDVRGKDLSEAKAVLTGANLKLDDNVEFVPNKPQDADKVLEQNPDAGQRAKKGALVHLKVAVAPTVPDVRGKTIPDAAIALTAAKLTLDPNVETVQSKPEDSDKVVDQKPAANEKAKEGDAVHLKVGAHMVTVPLVIGHRYEDAQVLLANSHLTVGQVTNQSHPNFAGGVVFAQYPNLGAAVLSGSAVNLSVTPRTVAVPRVTGVPFAQAVQRLHRAGLAAGTLTGDMVLLPVSGQNPQPSVLVPVGSRVDLAVPKSPWCTITGKCLFTGTAVRVMTAPVTASPLR